MVFQAHWMWKSVILLTQDNIWRVTTRGISDQDTLFNPTNHVYFNLTGDASSNDRSTSSFGLNKVKLRPHVLRSGTVFL